MAQSTNDQIWLTQEAFDKLQSEYDYLTTTGRAAVTAKIAAAREEGDLSENGGYHAAREEQGQMEARIVILKDKLERAQVGESVASDVVVAGNIVTIAFDGDLDDTETFLLGSREVLALDESVEVQVYSPQSPIGAAVLGHKKGDAVSYQAPTGKSINITIVGFKQS
ncbi:MAG: transcription elongation factor GreA [Propionibacteriaceae bacterium]